MSQFILLEQFHLTILAAGHLPSTTQDALVHRLRQRRFRRRLRRLLRRRLARDSVLGQARLHVSR